MEELAKTIAEQAGIPEAKAQQAAQIAINFLKEKLPAPLAGQLDAALNNPNNAQVAANLLGKGMGLLGKK